MTRRESFDAKDAILQAACNMALIYEESGQTREAQNVRDEATRLAKRWKIEKPGLPESAKV